MLDNFALLSGQITTLNRLLKNDKTPPLRNYVFLPLVLAPERDPALEVRIAKPVLMTLGMSSIVDESINQHFHFVN